MKMHAFEVLVFVNPGINLLPHKWKTNLFGFLFIRIIVIIMAEEIQYSDRLHIQLSALRNRCFRS